MKTEQRPSDGLFGAPRASSLNAYNVIKAPIGNNAVAAPIPKEHVTSFTGFQAELSVVKAAAVETSQSGLKKFSRSKIRWPNDCSSLQSLLDG